MRVNKKGTRTILFKNAIFDIIFQLVVWLGLIVLLSIIAGMLLAIVLLVVGTILDWTSKKGIVK